jgi:hypothetical protein
MSTISNFGLNSNSLTLRVININSGRKYDITGLLSDVSNTWSQNWKKEQVYGRIDPIATYSGTERTVSFSILLTGGDGENLVKTNPGVSEDVDSNAKVNMSQLNDFAQGCYPAYEGLTVGEGENQQVFNTAVLKAPPMLKVQIANILSNPEGGPLLAYCTNFSYTIENKGLFEAVSYRDGSPSVAYYSRITANFEFSILHDFELGHDETGKRKTPSAYPFKL